jgi:hypothetical protein
MTQELVTAGLIVVFFAWTITMQVIRKSVRVKRLVLLPAGFAVLALVSDHGWVQRLGPPVALAFFGLGLLLAVGMGLIRSTTIKMWRTESGWVSKGGWLTVVTWLATIALRLAVVLVGLRFGVTEGAGEILLFVAVTIATQNLVVAKRADLFDRTAPAAVVPAGMS